MNLDQARFFMVEQQIRPWDVLDPIILDLFMDIPRHDFVEDDQIELAYMDIELPIGHDQAMMSPKIEGKMLQALDIDKAESVLEIGTGSGYLTAMLASLSKQVTTIELYEDIQDKAKTRLTGIDNIEFQVGDAANDWADNKYYDVIVLTGSVEHVPEAYKNKLSLGGRLAVISGHSPAMTAQVVTRISEQEWDIESLFETDLPRLVNPRKASAFAF